MADAGLSNRLRHHTRRSGVMVGLSMALAIAVCVGSFVVIYGQLTPLASDFIGIAEAENTATRVARRPTAADAAVVLQTQTPGAADVAEAPPAEPTTAAPPAPEPTSTPAEFEATHRSNPDTAVNLRSEPSREGGGDTVIVALTAGTELQYLDEERADERDEIWLRVTTEDDQEGWVLESTTEELTGST